MASWSTSFRYSIHTLYTMPGKILCTPHNESHINRGYKDALDFHKNYSSFQGFSPGRLQDFLVDRGDLQDKDWSNRGTRRIDEREAEKEQHRQLAHLLCLF